MKLLLVFMSTIFFACKKQNLTNTGCWDLGTVTVELNNCSGKGASGTTPDLCFVQLVEDSRCPANTACVWEGVAIARFSFTVNTTQHQLTLATKKFTGRPSTDTTVSGYTVKLLNVSPYPGSGTDPVRATVQITH